MWNFILFLKNKINVFIGKSFDVNLNFLVIIIYIVVKLVRYIEVLDE